MTPQVDPDNPTQTPRPTIPAPPKPEVETEIDELVNKSFEGSDPTDRQNPNTTP
jgi:hypothetical protein